MPVKVRREIPAEIRHSVTMAPAGNVSPIASAVRLRHRSGRVICNSVRHVQPHDLHDLFLDSILGAGTDMTVKEACQKSRRASGGNLNLDSTIDVRPHVFRADYTSSMHFLDKCEWKITMEWGEYNLVRQISFCNIPR